MSQENLESKYLSDLKNLEIDRNNFEQLFEKTQQEYLDFKN